MNDTPFYPLPLELRGLFYNDPVVHQILTEAWTSNFSYKQALEQLTTALAKLRARELEEVLHEQAKRGPSQLFIVGEGGAR